MTDKSRELVPDSWSLVPERAPTPNLIRKGGIHEHSSISQKNGAAEKECKSEEGPADRRGA